MNVVALVGSRAVARTRRIRHETAIVWALFWLALRPSSWPRSVRSVFARQMLFTGVEAIPFVSLIALLAGVSLVIQAQLWMSRLGQSELLGPLLVTVIAREVGPLLVNFVVIGRSSTAIAAELAGMKVRHEVNVLDAQGIEPMIYLVMPRVLAVASSVFCLTVVFIVVSFGIGYVLGAMVGTGPADFGLFLNSIVLGVQPADFGNIAAKTLLPGLFAGVIAVNEGLGVDMAATEIPQAVTRCVVRSNAMVLVISAIVSVLTYA